MPGLEAEEDPFHLVEVTFAGAAFEKVPDAEAVFEDFGVAASAAVFELLEFGREFGSQPARAVEIVRELRSVAFQEGDRPLMDGQEILVQAAHLGQARRVHAEVAGDPGQFVPVPEAPFEDLADVVAEVEAEEAHGPDEDGACDALGHGQKGEDSGSRART